MVNEVNLALYLICHHGHWDDFIRDAEIIQRVSLEKGVPITYFFSGLQLEKMAEQRGAIHNARWCDVIGGMQGGRFVNPRSGYHHAHLSEIGIMPYSHIPLVQPWGRFIQAEYFDGILRDQIRWSKGVVERHYQKTPVTIHPPDGVYSPSAAKMLREGGLDTVVVSGEFLGSDQHAKGILYWASGLRHIVRTNDIQLPSPGFWDAKVFLDAVEEYGHRNNIGFVVVGCDSNELYGMREVSLHDGVARLCCIGDEAYRRCGRIKLVNCNAVAHGNLHSTDLEKFWGGWDDVRSMIGDGSLNFLDEGKNWEVGHVAYLIGERFRQGWDGQVIQEAKECLWRAADMACRNKHYAGALEAHYQGNIKRARHLLQG